MINFALDVTGWGALGLKSKPSNRLIRSSMGYQNERPLARMQKIPVYGVLSRSKVPPVVEDDENEYSALVFYSGEAESRSALKIIVDSKKYTASSEIPQKTKNISSGYDPVMYFIKEGIKIKDVAPTRGGSGVYGARRLEEIVGGLSLKKGANKAANSNIIHEWYTANKDKIASQLNPRQ